MQTFISVPFKSEHGLSQTNGLAKFSSAGIVLEYESKIIGLISQGVKDAQLPIADILDIKFKKGVMKRGAKIEIRLRSITRLAELPNKDGKISLSIRTDDWERARDAVERITKDIEEHAAGLPPPHPPLASLFEDDTAELDPK